MLGIPSYNATIRQATAVFGSLFNNIVIRRRDGKILPVPIAYGPRAKWLEAQKSLQPQEEMFEKLLPRMSYELTAMNYDTNRKLTNAQKVKGIAPNNSRVVQKISAPVPYNLDFSLYIETKNLNDGWQIVEQILPYFTPAYTVRVRNWPSDYDSDTPIMTNEYDMPFVLQAITWADDWTGEIAERRSVEWTLEFNTKIWMSAPVSSTSIILDSRAIIAVPPGNMTVTQASRTTPQEGTEVGYASVDSEIAIFQTPNGISPNIINTIDSDGNIVKIIRHIEVL